MASSTESNYYAQILMDYLLKGTTPSRPTNGCWIGLFTTLPQMDGTGGVEVSSSGTNYQRVQIADNAWTGPSGSNLTYSNTNPLTFPIPSGNWGTVVGMCIFDAQTNGNLIATSYISAPRTINNGDGAPIIPAGQITVSRAVC